MKLISGMILIIWLATGGAMECKFLEHKDGYYRVEPVQMYTEDLMNRYCHIWPSEILIPENNVKFINIKSSSKQEGAQDSGRTSCFLRPQRIVETGGTVTIYKNEDPDK